MESQKNPLYLFRTSETDEQMIILKEKHGNEILLYPVKISVYIRSASPLSPDTNFKKKNLRKPKLYVRDIKRFTNSLMIPVFCGLQMIGRGQRT